MFALLAACSRGDGSRMPDGASSTSDGATRDTQPIHDADGDGLDDDWERMLAATYVPYVSLDPGDGCPLSGMIARVRKHPANATKILIVYSHVFQRDCGINGHVGDNEAFGIAIDPAVPPPAGILAIRTASHQNTPCERVSECTTCANDSRTRCDFASDGGAQWPVLYASKDKHGQYATKAQCPFIGTCFDQCTLAPQRARPPVVNVGEPAAPLTHDLTADGFITPANGWSEPSLMHHDPWNVMIDFGDAGNVADDLQDTEFEAAPCS